MIYISTNNGVFRYDEGREAKRILSPTGSLGFFGIVYDEKRNRILAASREKLKLAWHSKHGSDVKLYEINPETGEHALLDSIYKVFDVHQIDVFQDNLFLTDTTKNRIHVYDLVKKKRTGIINFGKQRKDIHHINAIRFINGRLLVGLNNKGEDHASIFSMPAEKALQLSFAKSDVLGRGEITPLNGIRHSHDIEPWQNEIYICASHDGYVIRQSDFQKVLIIENAFVRGLAGTKKGLWVGLSARAKRSERHNLTLNGEAHLYDLSRGKLLKKVIIKGAGQVNDMISLNE